MIAKNYIVPILENYHIFLAVCLFLQKLKDINFYHPLKRSLGQSNIFTGVCQSFCSQGGLCMMSLPVWLPGPMFLPGRGICVSGPMFLGDGVSVQEGGLYPGEGVCQRDPPDRDTHPLVRWREGGTHPTRMLSCNYLSIIKPNSLSNSCLFFLSDEYDFIPVVEPQNNCNPIVLENHKLGVQIWATKVLFSYAYAELMNIVKSRQSIKTTG